MVWVVIFTIRHVTVQMVVRGGTFWRRLRSFVVYELRETSLRNRVQNLTLLSLRASQDCFQTFVDEHITLSILSFSTK